MAAQIENPRDIAGPRKADPADAARRSVVLDKYRQGEVTASKTDPNANGHVSTAVQN
jgi:pilus assembly protein CpaD